MLFVFVANLIAKYEVLLDTQHQSALRSNKDETLIKDGADEDAENKENYDLNQIHDLGFTLSPKPFSLLLKKREN